MFGEHNETNLVPLTISSAVVEIDQYYPGWQLAQPSGEDPTQVRLFKMHVPFNAPFANLPMVHVGLTGFDIDNSDTVRLSVRTGEITASGFDLLVLTWLNTRVYKVQVSWIALGHQATL